MGAFFSSSSEENNESVTLQYINLFNAVMEFGEPLLDDYGRYVTVTNIFSNEKMLFDYKEDFGYFGYEITLRQNQTVEQMRTELTNFWKSVSRSFDETWKLAKNSRNEDLAKGGITIEFKISNSSEFTKKILHALTGEIIAMIPRNFWFRWVFSSPERIRDPQKREEFQKNIEEFKKVVSDRFVQMANLNYEYNAKKVTDVQIPVFNNTYSLEWTVFIESLFVDMRSLRQKARNGPRGLYVFFMSASGPLTDPSFPKDDSNFGTIKVTPNPVNQ